MLLLPGLVIRGRLLERHFDGDERGNVVWNFNFI
jgi:hypothetical protein